MSDGAGRARIVLSVLSADVTIIVVLVVLALEAAAVLAVFGRLLGEALGESSGVGRFRSGGGGGGGGVPSMLADRSFLSASF